MVMIIPFLSLRSGVMLGLFTTKTREPYSHHSGFVCASPANVVFEIERNSPKLSFPQTCPRWFVLGCHTRSAQPNVARVDAESDKIPWRVCIAEVYPKQIWEGSQSTSAKLKLTHGKFQENNHCFSKILPCNKAICFISNRRCESVFLIGWVGSRSSNFNACGCGKFHQEQLWLQHLS